MAASYVCPARVALQVITLIYTTILFFYFLEYESTSTGLGGFSHHANCERMWA